MADEPKGGSASSTSTTPDVMAEFRKLLREQSSSAASGTALSEREERLLKENYKMRDRLRTTITQLDAANKGKPADGQRVLTKEEADTFDAFTKLGIAAKDLPAILTERSTLLTEKQGRDADALNMEIATALELNPRAFQLFAKAQGLTVSFKDVRTKDEDNPGKFLVERVPVLVKKDAKAGDEPELLVDVLERDYAADIPLLTADVGGRQDDDPTGYGAPVTRDGLLPRSTAARQSALPDEQGTRFPVTRSAPPNNAQRARKEQQDASDRKRAGGAYSI